MYVLALSDKLQYTHTIRYRAIYKMRALLFCMNDKARFFELETLNCDLKASFSSLVSLFIVTSFLKKWLICPIFYNILPNWGG